VVETCWDLVCSGLMRALVIERVAKVIKAALLCAKRCRRQFRRVLLQRAMHPLMAIVLQTNQTAAGHSEVCLDNFIPESYEQHSDFLLAQLVGCITPQQLAPKLV
jgi:hypothetical protein